MAEENQHEYTATNLDDMSVLRELLHTIRGISPVSSLQYELAEADLMGDSDISYNE